jgi:hypothetical protein
VNRQAAKFAEEEEERERERKRGRAEKQRHRVIMIYSFSLLRTILRENAVFDAPLRLLVRRRRSEEDAERPGRHSHAERGNECYESIK